ncbi:hypothetical protein GWI33_002461 [Rhynchophorus ferrugineus]|uniref:Uncharacterized protein n=1 Tax=Rhynchophorus ferrugineus TaxID=354439 RepID=A0A834ITS4_RHYFE|nr:hypothetical protein GWI33_002461 [Rhynchophorus ferrugineus]
MYALRKKKDPFNDGGRFSTSHKQRKPRAKAQILKLRFISEQWERPGGQNGSTEGQDIAGRRQPFTHSRTSSH